MGAMRVLIGECGRQGHIKKGWLYVSFSYLSADGEEGFPGNMDCTITYGLSQNAELSIEYAANVDAACPVNLTNHAYFNLKGQGAAIFWTTSSPLILPLFASR